MQSSPLQRHPERTSRKPATQNGERIDADFNLGACVDRVKMRWIVVIIVHANGDSKEAAYFRHAQILSLDLHLSVANLYVPPVWERRLCLPN